MKTRQLSLSKSRRTKGHESGRKGRFFIVAGSGRRTGVRGKGEGKKLRAESGSERRLEGVWSKDGASQV